MIIFILSSFMLNVIDGNIFTTNSDVLVNTVNCEGFMGKGIALEFKLRYSLMFDKYKSFCEEKKFTPGKLWLYKEEKPFVLCFPTKNYFKHPSKIEYLELGLKNFVNIYKSFGVKSISFPLLGASNGKINPEFSLELMEKYLSPIMDLDITIVRNFIPEKDENIQQFINFIKSGPKIDSLNAASYNRLSNIINDNEYRINSLSDILTIKQDIISQDGRYIKQGVTETTIIKAFEAFKDIKSVPYQSDLSEYLNN